MWASGPILGAQLLGFNLIHSMSARQIARLRALIEEKKKEAEGVNVDVDEEEYYEEPTKVSFSVLLYHLFHIGIYGQ